MRTNYLPGNSMWMQSLLLRTTYFLLFVIASAAPVLAQADLPSARPVPRMQVIPLPNDEVSVECDGREITRYHFASHEKSADRRPFLYPIVGPSGKSLTRMGHPHDPNGHSHHNSVWVSHNDVGGISFWADSGKGRIVPRRVIRYEDSDDEAYIQMQHAWIDDSGKTLLDEVRTLRFRPQEDRQWLLVIDLKLSAPKEPVILGKTPFGFVGVRMAKTIGVHDGGGTIRNSAGGVNEKEVFWKPAQWVDYSGPITKAAHEGITLMDHPSNPHHPAVFHVRDDGWMGATFSFAEPSTIQPDKPLALRYGLWIHAGVPSKEQIGSQFEAFFKIDAPSEPVKK